MRTLKFIVNNQTISQDPNCDFTGLVPGSDGYLQAEFVLPSSWRNGTIVASFWSALGKEYEPQMVRSDGTCNIPTEALTKRIFKIQLIGIGKDGKRMKTNKVIVMQNG